MSLALKPGPKRHQWRAPVQDLATYPEPYVTIAELARYWLVSRKQLYKQVQAGTLRAVRFGPRLLRIRTATALEFEASAKMRPPDEMPMPSRAAEFSVMAHAQPRRG
jgi:excisionase family DNA binding protein